jgi:Arc/MetJ-type ribon-helix-helix transcriptional regulator
MPKQYDAETWAKAVRLVQDHRGNFASESEAIRTGHSRWWARSGPNSPALVVLDGDAS